MGRRSPSRSPTRSSRRRHESSRRDDRDRRERGRSRSRSRDRRPPRRRESHDDAAPKTTEENGEISMSIEETNKLRISLGLKPLSLEKKAEKNVVNLQKTSAQVAEENEQLEIKKALETSKRKRELTQKLAGKSIGEQLKATGSTSALDWVKQSRIAVAEKEVKTKSESRHHEEATYDATSLAGMTVGHDLNAFEEGEEVVLTLKDSRILREDGNDVNDDDDELVNVELSERDRREARQKQALRASMPVYSGFDDDEFVEMGAALKRKKPKKSAVLAHYDEDEEMKQAEDSKKFTLDDQGASIAKVSSTETSKVDDLDEEVVSLSMNKSKSIDDYYTVEEMEAQFLKKGKKMRKKKKMRKVQDDGVDEPAGAQDATTLIQQLEEEAKLNENAKSDRGRRRRPNHDDDDEEEANLRRFQEAREKANAVAQSALAASSAPAKRKRRLAEVEDDVDLELSATLARARQIAQLKQQSSAPINMGNEEKIASIVSQAVATVDNDGDEHMGQNGGSAVVGNVFINSEAEEKANAVVFNDATDFETRLRSAIEQRSTQLGTISTGVSAQASATSASQRGGDDKEVDRGHEEQRSTDNTNANEEGEGEEEKEGWADDQPLVGMGMGATLALLKRTGDLRESRVERQAGRANDARDRNVEEELRVKDGVKLDYRDEFGRLLTKKEAFRLLSYKFHGHKPGKKKQDKRLKQLKEELEAQKLLSGEGSTKMMKVLEKKQGQAKQAYVVLSNGT